MKLLSGIKSRVEERVHQSQQPTLSRSSTAISTYVPQTLQQPKQPAPAAKEYILHIPETQMPACQAIQPAQQSQVAQTEQQQPRGQQSSYLVVDKQQQGTSRQLHITISQRQHLNPPSVASVTGKESANNISGFSSIFGSTQS